MKILLLSILINATTGAPVAMHIDAPYDSFEACGAAAQAQGAVLVHDNVATEYICRKVEDNGWVTPEVKVGPDQTPWEQWLKKQLEQQTEASS